MIQEVVGTQVGRYYLPAFGGVAFSNNEFRWSPRISREDGLVRLVPGLGTRAVDRLSDDYPVLLSPGQPGLRAKVTPEEQLRYAPRRVDLINLDANRFATVLIADLLQAVRVEIPDVQAGVLGVSTPTACTRSAASTGTARTDNLVATFEGLASNTPVPGADAVAAAGAPREDRRPGGHRVRPRRHRPLPAAVPPAVGPGRRRRRSAIPKDIPAERVIFAARRFVSNGRVPDLTHIVFVDPEAYAALGDAEALRDVGRAVGRLNKILPKRRFVLMGPGRWGSRGDIKLGVPVTYSDISNTPLLIEIASHREGSVPELSFGTHFFQDLVESSIRYLPLYPGEDGGVLNREFLTGARRTSSRRSCPSTRTSRPAIRVIDVAAASGGLLLKVAMNADEDEALGFSARLISCSP